MSAPVLSTEPVYSREKQRHAAADTRAIVDVYCIDEIAEHITARGFRSPCLQFPDDLVRHSAQIASAIEERSGVKCFVLADTSYSPCCVDEIAAQHVHGDVVFHFGNACLNAGRSLPVIYVCPRDVQADAAKFFESLGATEAADTLVYPDTKYIDLAHEVSGLAAQPMAIALPDAKRYTFVPEKQSITSGEICDAVPNRVLTRPLRADTADTRFVYITDSPSDSLVLQWSTMFAEVVIVNGRGEHLDVNVALRRRYRSVQQIKAAGTIGVLVNTLSLRDTSALLERTRRAITAAEKKFYMFVVGKPNVAKLGNFEAIDVWAVLGCPQGGIILNNEDYFRPIVTPYELEMAFNDEWTGKWLTRFEDIFASDITAQLDTKIDGATNEEPLFDLVTGRFVFNNTPLRRVRHLDLDTGSEVQKSSNALTIRNTVSTAAEHLQNRTWQGLGSDHQDITEEFAELKKGRSGIARNYNEQV